MKICAAEGLLRTTAHGSMRAAMRRWHETVTARKQSRRKHQLAEGLFSRTATGLRMITFRRWYHAVQQALSLIHI